MSASYLLTDASAADPATWGGKGAALARLAAAGLPVPPFVALAPAAFWHSVPDAPLAEDDTVSVPDTSVEALATLAPSPAVAEAIRSAVEALGADRLAVRSSAPDEDGAEHAFAGQLESFLGVAPADVPQRVADVWRSAFAPRVWAYRAARGIAGAPHPPAVLLQSIVDARAAGVAFTADPVTGDRATCVVAAVHGLASALVDGRADAETLRVDADGRVTERTPSDQPAMDRPAAGGVAEVPAPGGDVLSDAEAAAVAALARRAEAAFGAPQDVEWAFDADGTLWLVQSRPITTLGKAESGPAPQTAQPTGNRDGSHASSHTPHSPSTRLWDNSNIAESYGGVTTALTYSFARRAYAAVYRAFVRLLRVPEARVEAERATFEQMIGRIDGRVYYNLGAWYRVLALLPGYRLNAPMMEGMMGVREPIPDALRPDPPAVGRVRDALDLAGSVWGLLAARVGLARLSRSFYARLDEALAVGSDAVAAMPLDALAAHYRTVEARLLDRWDAPLVNDFVAMIAFGTAGTLAERWIGPGALGGLLAGDGDVVSAEPARRVHVMAATVAGDDEAIARLRQGDGAPLGDAVADYLARFGDRCLDELKLESPTLADDPSPLLHAVAATAERMAAGAVPPTGGAEADVRRAAEARMRAALAGHPLRRLVFGAVLGEARARVRDRENLRFERTRVFGHARAIVRAMGARLVEAGRLDRADDVFHLDLAELLGGVDGTATGADLRGLAAVRRAETDAWRAGPPPPDRFTTDGAVLTAPRIPTAAAPPVTGEVRIGLGCCPGVVEGPVRVVRDPRGVALAPGTILVAERTDPGWILLFPACAGLIVERGSLLSHSAIVARELGIPAAVSVAGATAWLADGDRVRLDGATGRVERLAPDA